MASRALIVVQTSSQWLLAEAGDPASVRTVADADTTADDLAELIRESAELKSGETVRIGILVGSPDVLAANFPLDDPRTRGNRELSYEMEVKVPLAAEEFTADFVIHDGEVFGACVASSRWEPIVLAFERRGLRLHFISPTALLAAQSLLPTCDILLWQHDEHAEWIRLRNQLPIAWRHLPLDRDDLSRTVHVESIRSETSLSLAVAGLDEETLRLLRSGAPDETQIDTIETESLLTHALNTATEVFAGTAMPWIELRREALAASDPLRAIGGSLRFTFAATLIFLICLCGALTYRSWKIGAAADELERSRQVVYREVFPNGAMPTAVLSRLRSEKQKLRGARGNTGELQWRPTGLRVLHDALSALPQQERFYIREIRIEDGELTIDVRMRSHGSVDVLVSALERQGFQVNAPATTRQSAEEVSSRIFAQKIFGADEPSEAAGGVL